MNQTEKPNTNAPAPFEAAETVIGRFRLLEQIGEDDFGVVYVAELKTPVEETNSESENKQPCIGRPDSYEYPKSPLFRAACSMPRLPFVFNRLRHNAEPFGGCCQTRRC
jgi:hypothetical protein